MLISSSGLINLINISIDESGQDSIRRIITLTLAIPHSDLYDASSDSDCSWFSSDSIRDVLEDLKTDSACLLDLEALYRSPIAHADPKPTTLIGTWDVCSLYRAYSDKISTRFPQAADNLVQRLGKANYERYRRGQKQRQTNMLAYLSEKRLETLGISGADSSKFHDYDISSSLHTSASSYAETVMSYGAGKGGKVWIPPLSERAKKGHTFVCEICGNLVKISNNSIWKQHIFGDLQPWICLDSSCSVDTKVFPTCEDWISHLIVDHEMGPSEDKWPTTECPLCRTEIGPGKLPITKHLSGHLEEISLAALPAHCQFYEKFQASESEDKKQGPDEDAENPAQAACLDALGNFHGQSDLDPDRLAYVEKRRSDFYQLKKLEAAEDGVDRVDLTKGWLESTVDFAPAEDKPNPDMKITKIRSQISEKKSRRLGKEAKQAAIEEIIEREYRRAAEAMRLVQEKAKKEIESARISAEQAVLECLEELRKTEAERRSKPLPRAASEEPNNVLLRPSETWPVVTLTETEENPILIQENKALLQCNLCPRRFTGPDYLLSHLRTHEDERPFMGKVCDKTLALSRECKRYEGLHDGEKKFVCKGDLKAGGQWGCGRRYARADALGRHFRSKDCMCIRPLIDEEKREWQRVGNEMAQKAQQMQQLQQQPLITLGTIGDEPQPFIPPVLIGGYKLPQALLEQYPALADMDWGAQAFAGQRR